MTQGYLPGLYADDVVAKLGLWWDDSEGLIRGQSLGPDWPNARRLVPLPDREALIEAIRDALDSEDWHTSGDAVAADAVLALLLGKRPPS